jgi:23S rRNA U2552 (ribose-2'-O)-methylase RlmE/FtsJ
MPVSIKKHRASQAWIARHINDPYVKQAQQKGYRARSAFKFIELDDKFKLLKLGQKVVDLGAAPGSWCQIASERTRVAGIQRCPILALDLLPMDPVVGVDFIQGDFREDDIIAHSQFAMRQQSRLGHERYVPQSKWRVQRRCCADGVAARALPRILPDLPGCRRSDGRQSLSRQRLQPND